ncbi:kynurenine/alpha-aminoadipate aminotransferase, mitochondrial [Cydia amplana]|uniref:kynurenine/alpha-aminoadipate aminotransferase, mitochondrial n=1 Tax=Cydia amplana TaxID=1869771 RepID=UPI002FE5B97C
MFVPSKLFHGHNMARRLLWPARAYSYNTDDFFKFYSDEGPNTEHRPLTKADYDRFISRRAARREPALTRQITTLAYGVGRQMITLAEGMPNEEVFPYSKLELASTAGPLHMEGKEIATALQYVPSQGLPALLSELRAFQQDLHRPPPLPRDVLVTNGGQHGIYQAIDMLLDEGDPILLPEYAYTGLHSALRPYRPEIITIPEDADGIVPDTLEAILAERLASGLPVPRLLYLVPNGNNPTGTTLPAGRRRQIYDLACKYDFLILEDDPYMFLNYDDEQRPSFLSLDTAGRVVRLDSLSKVVSAGLRGGWMTAPTPLLERAELHMQGEIIHSCTLGQCLVHHVVSNRPWLADHLQRARALYRRRRDALLEAIGPLEPLGEWQTPPGGLFLWMRVRGVDDVYNMVFETAFKRGLMLIPGHAFQYDIAMPSQHLRLTFSKIAVKDMPVAARLLADIIREEQQRCLQKQPQKIATQR